MINLEELMRLHAAASSGKWKISLVPDPEFPGVQIYRLYTGRRFLGEIDTHFPGDPEAHYIVAACNAMPELVARIRELDSEIKRRDAQRWADLCNEFDSGGPCPYFGGCPFYGKKCGDIRPEDWIKWLEEKK